jgi:uncharacterized protein YidB (DUF937 family)
MGLLDDLIAAAENKGSATAENSTQSAILQHVLGTVLSSQNGGLQGLLNKLKSGGLEAAVASWVSTAANKPVTGAQIQAALGDKWTQQLATKFGITPDQAAAYLSQILPEVVNHLTPNGTVPNQSALDQAVGLLKSRLMMPTPA